VSVTDELRENLRAAKAGHDCPVCGNRHGTISGRVVAVMAGVDQSSLSRFMAGGGLSSPILDKLAAWVAGR
jgi:hypothetical protein